MHIELDAAEIPAHLQNFFEPVPQPKNKDALGIPWLTAFALRADGWWLRSEIIWHKRAPMPESVTDRPTKAHEQVFLLTKAANYFYDAEAIREGNTEGSIERWANANALPVAGQKAIDRTGKPTAAFNEYREMNGRNRRSVWTLGPESYAGAHFATMPTKLVEPCILAGTSAHGCCAKCGSPWERVVEREFIPTQNPVNTKGSGQKGLDASNGWSETPRGITNSTTLGWQPTCTCGADVIPCTVLDPFSGSGTTVAVALKHHRNAIGIDLNESYISLAHDRIRRTQPLLLAAD